MNDKLTTWGPVLMVAGLTFIAGAIIYSSLLLINGAVKLAEVLP